MFEVTFPHADRLQPVSEADRSECKLLYWCDSLIICRCELSLQANAHLDNQQSFCNVLQRLLIGYRKRQDI